MGYINYLVVIPQGLVDIGSGAQLGIRRATSSTSSSPRTPSSTWLVEGDLEVDSSHQRLPTLLLRMVVRHKQPMEAQLNLGKVVSREAWTPVLPRPPHRRLA